MPFSSQKLICNHVWHIRFIILAVWNLYRYKANSKGYVVFATYPFEFIPT